MIDLPGETCTDDPALAMTTAIPRLDGPIHNARVTYDPGTMNVFLDSLHVLSIGIDLPSTLDLANGPMPTWGLPRAAASRTRSTTF